MFSSRAALEISIVTSTTFIKEISENIGGLIQTEKKEPKRGLTAGKGSMRIKGRTGHPCWSTSKASKIPCFGMHVVRVKLKGTISLTNEQTDENLKFST